MEAMFTAFFGEGIWAALQAVLILVFLSASIVKSLAIRALAYRFEDGPGLEAP